MFVIVSREEFLSPPFPWWFSSTSLARFPISFERRLSQVHLQVSDHFFIPFSHSSLLSAPALLLWAFKKRARFDSSHGKLLVANVLLHSGFLVQFW